MKHTTLLALACGGLLCGRITGDTPPSDVVEAPDHERYSVTAYQAGFQEAWRDVHENRLIIEQYGLPPPCWNDYMRLLEERYHVQVRKVAGCVVDEKIVGHVKGYNAVSEAEIKRRFGENVLDKTLADAVQIFREKNRTD